MKHEIRLTREQEVILETNYGVMKNTDLRDMLGLSQHTFYKELKRLGLSKCVQKTWLDSELKYLIANYPTLSEEELVSALGRPFSAIRKKANEMGVLRDSKWTDEELNILKNNYSKVSKTELLDLLPNRTLCAISQKVNKLKLKKQYHWSEAELTYLKENYNKASKEEILSVLNTRNWGSILHRAYRIGLKRKNKVK